MNRKIPFSAALVLVLIAVFLTYQIVTVSDEAKYNKIVDSFKVQPSDYPKLEELQDLVETKFVKEIDEDYLTTSLIYGYVLGLRDPYANYYTSDAFRDLNESLYGNLTGIGVRVTTEVVDDVERIVIFEVMDSSPAKEAGIMPGDILYSVGGVLYSELGYDGAMNAMLGEEGTVLTFEVLRGDRVVEFTLERRHFETQSVFYKMTDANANIGYIRIYEFSTSTVLQFKNAVDALIAEGATKLIFDVRNNLGGKYDSILSILDYLLPEGPIITTIDKSGNRSTDYSDENSIDLPMVVLANGQTASAAELFVASLIDYEKAIFIGTKTFGKGTVQEIFPLSDGSAVKFSTNYYLPPSEKSYDGVGIYPTDGYEIELDKKYPNIYLSGEKKDTQLSAAIKYLNSK
jgi:carboxyl-terminal processing protease